MSRVLAVAALALTALAAADTPVIVDTDMALDDARALALLTRLPGYEIVAVVTADGSASADAGARNAARVLAYLGHEDVPIGQGKSGTVEPPPWRAMSDALGWAALPGASREPCPAALALLRETLQDAEQPVVYLCLGPMTNLAALLASAPETVTRIKAVHHYGTRPGETPADWNTLADPDAARAVFATGLDIRPLTLPPGDEPRITEAFLESVARNESGAARLITVLHADPRVRQRVASGHLRLFDEAVVLRLANPDAWREGPPGEGAVREQFLGVLSSRAESRE